MTYRKSATVTATVVAENVRRVRGEMKLSLTDMAAELRRRGMVTATTTQLSRMEMGKAVITVDQLTAFAAVLDVSPASLLQPWSRHDDRALVELSGTGRAPARAMWEWIVATSPLAYRGVTSGRTTPQGWWRRKCGPRWPETGPAAVNG